MSRSEPSCFVQVREAQKLKRAYLEERRRRKEEAELEQCQPAPMTKKSRELAQKVAARRGSFFEREAKFSADRARKLERMKRHKVRTAQVIRHIGAQGLDRRGPAGSCRLFLGPGFRLAARWNRLVETVKTRKKREKTGKKWARYGLKRVKEGS